MVEMVEESPFSIDRRIAGKSEETHAKGRERESGGG